MGERTCGWRRACWLGRASAGGRCPAAGPAPCGRARRWGAGSGSQRASVTFEGDLDTPVGCPAGSAVVAGGVAARALRLQRAHRQRPAGASGELPSGSAARPRRGPAPEPDSLQRARRCRCGPRSAHGEPAAAAWPRGRVRRGLRRRGPSDRSRSARRRCSGDGSSITSDGETGGDLCKPVGASAGACLCEGRTRRRRFRRRQALMRAQGETWRWAVDRLAAAHSAKRASPPKPDCAMRAARMPVAAGAWRSSDGLGPIGQFHRTAGRHAQPQSTPAATRGAGRFTACAPAAAGSLRNTCHA
jgi:hypothetical protein